MTIQTFDEFSMTYLSVYRASYVLRTYMYMHCPKTNPHFDTLHAINAPGNTQSCP